MSKHSEEEDKYVEDSSYKQVVADENLSNLYKDTMGAVLIGARRLADEIKKTEGKDETP